MAEVFPTYTALVSCNYMESEQNTDSPLSWKSWFKHAFIPTTFQVEEEREYPSCLLFDYKEKVKFGVWELSFVNFACVLRHDLNQSFLLSTNYVQNEAYSVTKDTVIVPKAMQLFNIQGKNNESVCKYFSPPVKGIITNASPVLTVYIDALGSDNKAPKELFKSVHVLVAYKRLK
jgi:hypothetical protein